jgi:hypothetical protein
MKTNVFRILVVKHLKQIKSSADSVVNSQDIIKMDLREIDRDVVN